MMRLTFLMGVVAFSSPWGALAGFVMTDSNIYTARDAWLANPTAAEATYGHISTWETGGVTDMALLFCGCTYSWCGYQSSCNTAAASFNEDIGAWDTSGVTSMHYMFNFARAFNQDISSWSVGAVLDIEEMFEDASSFNQDLGWCLNNGVDLDDAFDDTQCESTYCGVMWETNTGDCDVSRTGNVMVNWKIKWAVNAWLADATAAEATYGHISTWQTGEVTDMSELFEDASSFNEDIGAWDTSGVTSMYRMFSDASSFDQDLGWCVADDVYLYDAFDDTQCESTSCGVAQAENSGDCDIARTGNIMVNWKIKWAAAAWLADATAAEATYGHISTWATGGVTDMSYLFSKYENSGAEFFNEDIGAWDTSSVTTMHWMFYQASAFDQDIGAWDTSGVTTMRMMFYDASAFDQDLGWCLGDSVSLYDAFANTPCASTSCGVGIMAALWCDGAMSDSNIRTAVSAWLSNPTAAEATYGHISTWQTGGVTDMQRLFEAHSVYGSYNSAAASFDEDISAWDTSGVTSMRYMFNFAKKFDQPIGDWQVDKVTAMEGMFRGAKAFDQDLGWCFDEDVKMKFAFKETKCVSRFCGVAQRDRLGICEPFARPCLIGRIRNNNTECHINSPTLIIIIVLAFAGFGAYVHRRKNKDETYVAAARRLLYSCLCYCFLCCRKRKEASGVNSQPASQAESPPELGPEEPDEEETRAAAEETTVEESVEPSFLSKKFTWFFGEQKETPKEEEEAAALPVFAEAEEEATEPPPPPPARRWFLSAEPEPASAEETFPVAEAEEPTSAEQPPPPARRWFSEAEPET